MTLQKRPLPPGFWDHSVNSTPYLDACNASHPSLGLSESASWPFNGPESPCSSTRAFWNREMLTHLNSAEYSGMAPSDFSRSR